jgi:hypothetical protein
MGGNHHWNTQLYAWLFILNTDTARLSSEKV